MVCDESGNVITAQALHNKFPNVSFYISPGLALTNYPAHCCSVWERLSKDGVCLCSDCRLC